MLEIGEVITGKTPSKKQSEFYGEDYPFYKPTDLNQGVSVRDSIDGLTEKGLKHTRFLPAKSILVTCIGATIGKTGLIKKAGSCNQQINAIIPYSGIAPLFIYYQIISSEFQRRIVENASSTTLPILNKSKFQRLGFKVAPLPEQHRIVAKIEELFSELDNGIANLEKAKAQLKVYRQAVLKSAFEGKLTEQWRSGQMAAGTLPSAEDLLARIQEERQNHYDQQVAEWRKAVAEWEANASSAEAGRRRGKEGRPPTPPGSGGRRKPSKPKKPKEYSPLTEKELGELPELPVGWKWVRFDFFITGIEAGKSFKCDERPPTSDEIGVAKVS
ncbi:MAG: restriction endonuclease subunit S [Lewinellaceae bacterium]|nr:restriction endonuclease subunit S [Lewinellaceae bacterium]